MSDTGNESWTSSGLLPIHVPFYFGSALLCSNFKCQAPLKWGLWRREFINTTYYMSCFPSELTMFTKMHCAFIPPCADRERRLGSDPVVRTGSYVSLEGLLERDNSRVYPLKSTFCLVAFIVKKSHVMPPWNVFGKVGRDGRKWLE